MCVQLGCTINCRKTQNLNSHYIMGSIAHSLAHIALCVQVTLDLHVEIFASRQSQLLLCHSQ